MLNVVAVGEVKKRGGDDFNNAQIGQAISFGEKVLQLQPRSVYEGMHNDVLVTVKMAKRANYLPCFENENTALNDLSNLNSLHIPKVLFNSKDALVMSQVGERISNLRKKEC